MSKVSIRTAKRETDHVALLQLSRQSKHTRDFSNMIFSGIDCYEAGRIRVAILEGTIVGFTCLRHRTKVKPATVLYFITVNKEYWHMGIGMLLMADLERQAKAAQRPMIELKVAKDNPAVAFYERLGYAREEETFKGKAWVMRKPL